MRGKILKVTIASMLLITLTAINFVSVGTGLISYALDGTVTTAKTNNENVKFSAYLKDQAGTKTASQKVDINSQEMKMYLTVEVAKEGYFNGEIKLENSNFEFVSSQSENVSKVSADTLTLNQINAGASPEIEVTVKPKLSEDFNLDLLNMESKLSLTGVYRDSTQRDVKISGTTSLQIEYVSANVEENIENSAEVITNKIGMYNGEEKRIVQVLIKTGMKNNTYPVKHITTKVNIPKINGEEPILENKVTLKGMSQYNVTNENDTTTVEISNEANNENKIKWSKNGNEEIILTYIYNKNIEVKGTNLTANTTMTLYDGAMVTNALSTATVNEEKDGIITLNEKMEDSIYKGKIYAGVDKELKSETEIKVNLDKATEAIYVNENTTSIPSEYVRTTISKKEMISLLGENGVVEITSNNGIFTLTKSSQTDENDNIVINYPQGVSNISIRTTKPQTAGELKLSNVKVIRAANAEVVKNATEITTELNGTYDTKSAQKGVIPTTTASTQLKETTTVAKIESNRNSLSTITENKNVEIKATLLSNSEEYDLYKNPTIEIELPADVVNAKINSVNKVYGDEFAEVNFTQEVVNGRQVIKVNLVGTQSEYKDPGIEGTQILINADLMLNNKATSKQDTIKMTYTNENANQYKEAAQNGTEVINMEVVSPKGLITTNNIEALGVQTIGDQEKVTATLDKNAEEKQVKIEEEIINNNETAINNIAVLGNFATDGTQNNLHATLMSGISIEGIDTGKVKVYYTENEAATADLENSENAWSEQATAVAKKYLITVTDMQIVERIKVSYDMQIPSGLDYNQIATQGYEVSYVESNTGVAQSIKSTTIELTTGEGPVVEARLIAQKGSENLENNKEVKQGEIVKYTTQVRNSGAKAATVKVTSDLPQGLEIIKDSNEQIVENLQPGEVREVEYEAQVTKQAEVNSEISTKSTIQYEEVTKETNTISNKVTEGDMSIYVTHDDAFCPDEGKIVIDDNTSYMATIKNLTDTEQRNVKFTWELNGEIEIISQETMTEEVFTKSRRGENMYEDEGYARLENSKEITIDSIPANSTLVVYIQVSAKQIKEQSKDFTISATIDNGNKTYESNIATGTVLNNSQYGITLSANNENEYVKAGDIIEYKIKVENKNNITVPSVLVEDSIAKELTITGVTVGDENVGVPSDNDVKVSVNMKPGEEKEIKISTLVNYQEGMSTDEEITNKATMTTIAGELTSNEISHTMTAISKNNKNENKENEYKDKEGNVIETFKISGIAWEDQDANGQRDEQEPTINGMNVKLLNIATNELATNPNGERISTATTADGKYTLSGIPTGEYVVIFGYDASTYRLTEYEKVGVDASRNSNAITEKLQLDGEAKTYGVTDIISLKTNSIANTNIGLVRSEKFDMKLEKFVNKVVIQSASGTKTYNYNNESLAKIEIPAKEVNGANAIIEYKIKVTNAGELEGYVKNIVDYLPKDLTFSSELNRDWYQEGANIYNNSLANKKIAPGESEEIILTVTKKMTEDNTGLTNNLAEIREDYNEAGVTDINSTPANKAQGENDLGSANVILSIRTGGPVLYTVLTIVLLLVLASGIYFVKREINLKKDEII